MALVPRVSLAVTTWFKVPELGMTAFEFLSRGSAFAVAPLAAAAAAAAAGGGTGPDGPLPPAAGETPEAGAAYAAEAAALGRAHTDRLGALEAGLVAWRRDLRTAVAEASARATAETKEYAAAQTALIMAQNVHLQEALLSKLLQQLPAAPRRPRASPAAVKELAPADVAITSTQPLGRGAFGVVYAGTWRGLPVAVKQVLADEGDGLEPEVVAAFERESALHFDRERPQPPLSHHIHAFTINLPSPSSPPSPSSSAPPQHSVGVRVRSGTPTPR